jgi:SAM-dependent methyltransferase
MSPDEERLSDALWRIYRRPEHPVPWDLDGNLPWNEPAFSERMLAEHLDQSHGAASRTNLERKKMLAWLLPRLDLGAGAHVLDFTCGPGLYAVDLARRGHRVTGIDFSPASIAHARALAADNGVQDSCEFIEQDVRQADLPSDTFDAALFIYGQLAVFAREEAAALLSKIVASLKPGGRLVIELLDQDLVDKESSSWWFTDDKGLWGNTPFLHLGERRWLEEEKLSVERYYIVDLQTHEMLTVNLCDQTYAIPEMVNMLGQAGFSHVDTYPDWGDVDLYDRGEWVVYVAQK